MKLSHLTLAIVVLPDLSLTTKPYVTEPLIVTSKHLTEPQTQATTATTMFERNDIKHLQTNNVPDLLSHIPNISIVQNNNHNNLTNLFLHGTNTNQTLNTGYHCHHNVRTERHQTSTNQQRTRSTQPHSKHIVTGKQIGRAHV